MYSIYSNKNKKLGELSEDGEFSTSNKNLKSVYDTMINFGVFLLSTKTSGKKVEVIRESVTRKDGSNFVKAIIINLESLGFIIKVDKE
jgi:hypothetical protein